MRTSTLFLFGTLIVAAAAPAAAGWREEISAFDQQRLAHMDEARQKGLAEAAAGPAADVRAIHEALDGARTDISEHELMGTWRCRMIKLGGLQPTKVYAWFTCRISRARGGLWFEKMGGLERFAGALGHDDGKGWVLLGSEYQVGASHHMAEKPEPYSGNGAGAGAQATPNDAVALITGAGPGRARVEFPYPVVESRFNVIELKRLR